MLAAGQKVLAVLRSSCQDVVADLPSHRERSLETQGTAPAFCFAVLDDPAPCGDQLAAKAAALYCVFGKSRAGFAAKKLNGRSWKECHMVGITGQSSTRGTW